MKALDGSVLVDKGELAGYGYSVLEDHKGLIGDIYVRPAWRDGEQQLRLFRSLLDRLMAYPAIRRIESQLMNLDVSVGRALQRERFIRLFERTLMVLDLEALLNCTARTAAMVPIVPKRPSRIEPWSDVYLDVTAGIISLAYHNHVDSQINDQYRSLSGARRFLHNIVEFPGCGMFYRPASFVAIEAETGCAAGVVLASFVAEHTGHITQLCVTPEARGTGLGYEMLRRSIEILRAHGAKQVSLTVTIDNKEAVRLYQRCGFRDVHRFFAYVWEPV